MMTMQVKGKKKKMGNKPITVNLFEKRLLVMLQSASKEEKIDG